MREAQETVLLIKTRESQVSHCAQEAGIGRKVGSYASVICMVLGGRGQVKGLEVIVTGTSTPHHLV